MAICRQQAPCLRILFRRSTICRWTLTFSSLCQQPITKLRRQTLKAWKCHAQQLQKLNLDCLQANVAMWLCFCIATAWPDVTLPGRLITGFGVIGHVEDAPVFRPSIRAPPQGQAVQLLGSAGSFVQELQRTLGPSKNPADDEVLLALCEKDVARGFASGFLTREALDCKYGKGQWRPLPRFPVYQAHNGKHRAIDDGSLDESTQLPWWQLLLLSTGNSAITPAQMSCKQVWMMSLQHTASSQLQMPTRGLLPLQAAAGAFSGNVRASFWPILQCVKLQPGAGVAGCSGAPTFGYPVLASREYGSAQQSFQRCCELLGVDLDPDKRTRMHTRFVYTGVLFDFTHALSQGVVQVEPKPG